MPGSRREYGLACTRGVYRHRPGHPANPGDWGRDLRPEAHVPYPMAPGSASSVATWIPEVMPGLRVLETVAVGPPPGRRGKRAGSLRATRDAVRRLRIRRAAATTRSRRASRQRTLRVGIARYGPGVITDREPGPAVDRRCRPATRVADAGPAEAPHRGSVRLWRGGSLWLGHWISTRKGAVLRGRGGKTGSFGWTRAMERPGAAASLRREVGPVGFEPTTSRLSSRVLQPA